MTGDAGEQPIEHVLKSGTGAELGKIGQDVAHQAHGILPGNQPGNSGDDEGVAAERLQLESDPGQVVMEAPGNGNLAEGEFNCLGKEQALRFNCAALALQLQPLEGDPFAGGVLVDDYQLRAGLAEDVFAVKLSDDGECREVTLGGLRPEGFPGFADRWGNNLGWIDQVWIYRRR